LFPSLAFSWNFVVVDVAVVVVVASVVVEKDRECYNLLLTLNPLSPYPTTTCSCSHSKL